MTKTAAVIYGADQDDPEEYPLALVFIAREVWEAGDEWFSSYDVAGFSEIIDELVERFDLDHLMENVLEADSQDSYDAVLKVLAKDPRFQWVEDVYDAPRID